ncbi:hypothetical protein WME99_08460 [Sorangium sp. So ce136]|uniref:hypothetical protein n=1 Tax=Sorangium sp. So ce136 TaxID=3133284 RepID=UPI003EFCF5CA
MSLVHGIPVVDLVVLIDSSESMKDLADTLSKVVGTAIRAARMKRRARSWRLDATR